MGATDFIHHAKGDSAQEAFNAAVAQAQYDYGHSGYSGSIAEKGSYVLVRREAMTPDDANALINAMFEDEDSVINDKWGPAGALLLTTGEWVFFGWASS